MRVVSEGPIRITKATIDAAWRRRGPDQRLILRDRDCRGLALIVNATSMTWSFAYRPRGMDPLTERRWANKTMTIGNPATHSPDDARTAANWVKGQAAAGADPAAEKKAKAVAERWKRAATLGRLLEEYAAALPRRPKMRGAGAPSPNYVAVEVAQVRLALAAIEAADLSAPDLTEGHVRRLTIAGDDVRNPRARFGAISRFLDWCQDLGHIQANPCALIARSRRPRAPLARAHYLTPAEIAQLWHAAEGLREPVWRDFTQFLMSVPCRRGEAARMEWQHLDLASAEWRQPGHLTKNRDPHRLHLNPLAISIILERHQAAGKPITGLVFSAPKSGKPVDTFTDLKRALSEASGLAGWTWHDFRRSFATALGEAGIPEAVADAILNHRQAATRGGVLGVYQRASRWPEQVKAMDLWGRLLDAAIRGQSVGANVVELAARAGRAVPTEICKKAQ